MTTKFQVPSSKFQLPIARRLGGAASPLAVGGAHGVTRPTRSIGNRQSAIGSGFTLVEILVTLVLLSLIVLALMAVFNSTQKAFRASLTQTDILSSGRLVMGLMTSDLEGMTPSLSQVNTNVTFGYLYHAGYDPYNTNDNFNFYATMANYVSAPSPLVQSLTASSRLRTNVLENFFSLSRQNVNGSPSWVGAGYAVFTNTPDTNGIYSLYRFYMTTNTMYGHPASLFNAFVQLNYTNTAVWSHLLDGVVDLTVTPYDPNGLEMTNTYEYYYAGSATTFTNQNTLFFPQLAFAGSAPAVYGVYMYSNTVPASVQVEMGVLEDRTLQHVEGLPDYAAQTNYLFNHAGQVHLFRQRVWIRNMNPAAYQ